MVEGSQTPDPHDRGTWRHDFGNIGDAVVHNALGRGHLALHQWREAADELTRATAAGLRTPELHAARSRALDELYHRALEDARYSGERRGSTIVEHQLRKVEFAAV